MHKGVRSLVFLSSAILTSSLVFATTPTITVTSPKNDSTSTSPVHFEVTATSSACSKGMSAVRVYSAPGVIAYTSPGGSLNAYLNLNAGTYDTTIVAYDNCGGTANADITVTASGEKKIGGFLYGINTGYDYGNNTNNVVGFSIVSSNGALAPLLQGPVDTNVMPWAVTSDSGGYRLYVGDYESGDVFAYFIDRDNGYLTPVPGAPFAVNRSVTAVAVHPSGDFVYATRDEQAAGDGITAFQVQSNGSLTEISGSPFATAETGPQGLVVDPSGNYLYVADYSGYVEAFQINRSTGALTELSGSPYYVSIPSSCNPGSGASADPNTIIDPFGTSVYTPDTSIGYISGWSISSSNGSLTPMSSSPFNDGGCAGNPYSAGPLPYGLAVDGTGKFLYVNNENVTPNFGVFSIGANGALTLVTNIDINCPNEGFTPIHTDSKGDYLYAQGCGGFLAYKIDHTTGGLTPLAGSPFYYAWTTSDAYAVQSFWVTP
jgi:6-phosphogluconolactonase (cycloisomerase 2 family)